MKRSRSKKPKRPSPPPGVLQTFLAASEGLSAAIKAGKQAIESKDRGRINESGGRVTDSLALDKYYAESQPDAPRWDYLAGVRTSDCQECVYGLEVHPATPGEVKRMVCKKNWAVSTLRKEGTERAVDHWFWIASGKVAIPSTTTEYRVLLMNQIQLVGHLRIESC